VAYEELLNQLDSSEVSDVDSYRVLISELQVLEHEVGEMTGHGIALEELKVEAAIELEGLCELRRDITIKRSEFVNSVLADNPHVKMSVIPYGNTATVETDFRNVIRKDNGTYQADIGEPNVGDAGILGGLYQNYPSEDCGVDEFELRLGSIKHQLTALSHGSYDAASVRKAKDQRFNSHIQQLKPEDLDRLSFWFPSDSLKVSYCPQADGKKFKSIDHGSPGQKTAAILAFLLAYGDEPMVLDQPEDDIDNLLIYGLIVQQLRNTKQRRQIVVITHNANIVVNGDAELVTVLAHNGQTHITISGGLQEQGVREEICRVMEGGRDAFEMRYKRINGVGA
jgi:hypothetical protein